MSPEPPIGEPPPSPLTQLAAAAVQTHEIFRAFVEAGFTEEQAMQMVCTVIATSMKG